MSAASDASSFASRLDDLASRLEGIDLYSEVSSIVTDLGELASASSDCADAVAAKACLGKVASAALRAVLRA